MGALQRSTQISVVLGNLSWLRRRSKSRSYGRPLRRMLLALPHGPFKNASSTAELHIPQALVSSLRWPSHVTWAGSCCLSLCGVSVVPGSKVNDACRRFWCARMTALRSLPAVTLHDAPDTLLLGANCTACWRFICPGSTLLRAACRLHQISLSTRYSHGHH